MTHYRRARARGATYFFTVVAYDRRHIMTRTVFRRVLREAFLLTRSERPFETVGLVLLPDHLHCLWQLPEGDADFGTRWRLAKTRVTQALRTAGWQVVSPTASRRRSNEQNVWHRRFWEHLVRDDRDFARHLDYIHYNPVKHGYVKRPIEWPFSTFHRYVRQGWYAKDWGVVTPESIAGWEATGE